MIRRWDIITIGNLSRNRYWGESDGQAYRPALCTCTLIRTDRWNLLVDPSLADGDRMAVELDRRTGLKLSDINMVFVTHSHGDHHAGLRHFIGARWLSSPSVADALSSGGQYSKPIEAVSGIIEGDVELLATPGHTLDHHSLRLVCDGQIVIIAGDAVMTRDFWLDRRGFHNSVDAGLASATIGQLAQVADIIVPGHDNYFLNNRQHKEQP